MIKLCNDPTCDETAAMSVQRQGDVEPVVYCLRHAYQREDELRQRLETFASVVLERPATELEIALARVQELEGTQPDGGTGGAGDGTGDGTSSAEQLATALHTLETQGRALASARSELADRDQALQVLRRELERTRAELERAKAAPAAPAAPATITPAPTTRPDPAAKP